MSQEKKTCYILGYLSFCLGLNACPAYNTKPPASSSVLVARKSKSPDPTTVNNGVFINSVPEGMLTDLGCKCFTLISGIFVAC